MKKKYELIRAFHPKAFETGIYAITFHEKGEKMTDKHTHFFHVKAKNKSLAIKIAKKQLM